MSSKRSCADVNSPYKRKCGTNSMVPLVNSLLWACNRSIKTLTALQMRYKTSLSATILTSVADPNHNDADSDPACHFDADEDPDPACHFDADPDSTFHCDAVPDLDPSFQIKAQNLRIQLITLMRMRMRIRIQHITLMGCGYGSGSRL